MNLHDSPESVIERVRLRLKDAEKKTPLHKVDYYEAIGVSYNKTNDDRQKMFSECMSILDSPETSPEKKAAEDTLQKLFSLE